MNRKNSSPIRNTIAPSCSSARFSIKSGFADPRPARAPFGWLLKALVRLLVGLAGVAAVYLAAAAVGTIWTAGPKQDAAGEGRRTVYILSNGYHSDIALAVHEGILPDGLPVAAADFPAGLDNVRYLAIGWGSEAAYTSLGSITDLSVSTAMKALAFDRSVIHVQPYYGSPAGTGVYPVEMSEDQYRKLLAFLSATFDTNGAGRGDLVAGASHGYGDIFYRARPRFSPFYGCNVWTGQALRQAGVRMGRWTPFVQSLEWSLSSTAGPGQ